VRISVQVPVRVIAGGMVIQALGTDLNEHGLFLQTTESMPSDPPLQLEITLPDGLVTLEGRPRFMGRTIWGQGVGIEFSHATDDARFTWLKYVRSFTR
jgi:hypothetical protein